MRMLSIATWLNQYQRVVNEHNRDYFYDLFDNNENIGGGPIESLVYQPNQLQASITFKSKSTADGLLEKREFHYESFVFIVTPTYEYDKF